MKSMACVPLALVLAAGSLQAAGRPNLPPNLNGIGIEQKLNAQIPLDTAFRNESGTSVPLRTFFRRQAGGAGSGLLSLPHVMQPNFERRGGGAASACR